MDADSPNYLWPALLQLNGEGFIHNAGLNFLYPGLLFLLLRVFKDFRSIVVLQHLFGTAAGVFFLLAWDRLGMLDSASIRRRVLHKGMGLFGAGIYLLSPMPIMFELHIRPEALCMFVQTLSFWLTVQFICYRRALAIPKMFVYGIAGVATALLLCSFKPSYMLTALLTIAFLLWLVIRAKLSWKYRSLFVGGAIMVTLLFVVPEHLLGRRDRLTRMFLPQTLFSVHADIIRAQIGDDLARGVSVPFPRPWLQTAFDELGTEISRFKVSVPEQFSILGFNPDHLMNGDDAIFNRWMQQLGNDEYEKFLSYYYWRALRCRPFLFLSKVVRQMKVFYTSECPAFISYPRIYLIAWHYQGSRTVITDPENWAQFGKTSAGIRLLTQTDRLLTNEIIFNSGKRLFYFHRLLAWGYLPVLLVGVGGALWSLLIRKRPRANYWPSMLVIFFFLPNFGNVLAISAVHSMEVLRYSTIQFAAALFCELWAIRYLLDLGLDCLESKLLGGRERSVDHAS